MMMKKIVLVVATTLVASTLAIRDVSDYKGNFAEWINKYNKNYGASEFHHRFSTFCSNLDYVTKFNGEQNGMTLEMNMFADLTSEEFSNMYLGLNYNHEEEKLKAKNYVEFGSDVVVPDTIDWRTQGAVTPVKNQGQCGSCWSFSTTGSTEGAWKLAGHTLVGLSEQNLMDCSTSQGNQGCNGGLMDNAFKYIIANKGIDSESSYPYKGQDGTCAFNAANVAATISSFVDIPTKNETALQAAVGSVGPVSVAIDAGQISFQLYHSGVYHSLLCSQTRLDHGVLAVGYGTDGSDDYWIVKNSWGPDWGQQGYIWMSRNKNNNCGIATSASYPKI